MSDVKHTAILKMLQSRLEPSNKLDSICIAPIKCADGLVMSVQASHFHYCDPRNDKGPWSTVEVGFPSERVERLMPYVEDANKPTDTVYARVPIEIVAEIIAEHGGFAAIAKATGEDCDV